YQLREQQKAPLPHICRKRAAAEGIAPAESDGGRMVLGVPFCKQSDEMAFLRKSDRLAALRPNRAAV
ncbi:MAG: hypothetical protein ACI4IV_01935, partial [Acutalibacteraceae bacterium]